MNRRRFLSFVPGLLAAPAAAQTAAQNPRIDRLRLDCAESIFGVDFTEAEEAMALNGVN